MTQELQQRLQVATPFTIIDRGMLYIIGAPGSAEPNAVVAALEELKGLGEIKDYRFSEDTEPACVLITA